MAKEEIFEKLKELVVDQLGVEEDEVTMEASMQDDLGADSLDLVDLVMSVEEEFGASPSRFTVYPDSLVISISPVAEMFE